MCPLALPWFCELGEQLASQVRRCQQAAPSSWYPSLLHQLPYPAHSAASLSLTYLIFEASVHLFWAFMYGLTTSAMANRTQNNNNE